MWCTPIWLKITYFLRVGKCNQAGTSQRIPLKKKVLCFKPDILTMSIFFTFASKEQICMFSDRWSTLSPFDQSLFTWVFFQILQTIIIWRISWCKVSRDNCLNNSGNSYYNRRIIYFIVKYEGGFCLYWRPFCFFTNTFGGWLYVYFL